jgi:hypothetical protein
MFTGKGGTKKEDGRKSAPQGTSVGSGSRPSKSRHVLDSSAPADPKNLGGRGNVPGALK